MHKYFIVFLCLLVALFITFTPSEDTFVLDSPLSGGDTTVFNTSREAFAKPAPNLSVEDLRKFTFGNKMFNTNWVTAPASVTSLDGLGPTFNRVSCSGCHFKDGRGRPPKDRQEAMASMLIRLSVVGQDKFGGPKPHPHYGGQLNDRSILSVPVEGRAEVTYEEVPGVYPDGETYSLRHPIYTFKDLKFGSLDDALFSPRVAPVVYGMGLLEAIPEETILSFSDIDDVDGDGISGRPNRVWSPTKNKEALGRFGWKANAVTVEEQSAGAAVGDIGITTSLNKNQNCPDIQKSCQNAKHGGVPEMSDMQLDRMVFYLQTLAVPARRHLDDPNVQAGAKLFVKAKCSSCHRPTMKTGDHALKQVAFQDIQPFTDLLLHDMGEGLADHRPDFQANGREWRTPPLWGIGLVKTVNRHTTLLHDGRARNLEEAILWHGGEAQSSKQSFMKMNKDERRQLITFLESL